MVKLKALTKDDKYVPELVELFNCVFGGMTAELWAWKHLQNPLLEAASTIAAMINGKIIGAISFMPAEYIVQGERCKVLQSCDAMVHPEYRGRGISTKIRTAAEEYYKDLGYQFMIAFPNEQSLPGALKVGWLHLFNLDSFVLFQNSYPLLKNFAPRFLAKIGSFPLDRYHLITKKILGRTATQRKGLRIRTYEKCPPAIITINKKKATSLNRMHLSFEYLNWRLDRKPGAKYSYIVVEDDVQPIAYAIVNLPISPGDKGIARIIDLDTIPGDIQALDFLIAATVKYLAGRCNLVHLPLYNGRAAHGKIFRNHGFISLKILPSKSKSYPFIAWLLDEDHFSTGTCNDTGELPCDVFRKKSNWKISLLDTDLA